jgi:preprotein translocase subunit SecG
MYAFFTALHVIVCIMLILIVLLQTGKGAEMGAAFGGSTQTVFGSSGPAGFLNKLTTAVAILFMVTSLLLCYFSGRVSIQTIMDEKMEQTGQAAPPVAEQLPAPAVEEKLPVPVEEQGDSLPESLPK